MRAISILIFLFSFNLLAMPSGFEKGCDFNEVFFGINQDTSKYYKTYYEIKNGKKIVSYETDLRGLKSYYKKLAKGYLSCFTKLADVFDSQCNFQIGSGVIKTADPKNFRKKEFTPIYLSKSMTKKYQEYLVSARNSILSCVDDARPGWFGYIDENNPGRGVNYYSSIINIFELLSGHKQLGERIHFHKKVLGCSKDGCRARIKMKITTDKDSKFELDLIDD